MSVAQAQTVTAFNRHGGVGRPTGGTPLAAGSVAPLVVTLAA